MTPANPARPPEMDQDACFAKLVALLHPGDLACPACVSIAAIATRCSTFAAPPAAGSAIVRRRPTETYGPARGIPRWSNASPLHQAARQYRFGR
jgi:hypothetical protein